MAGLQTTLKNSKIDKSKVILIEDEDLQKIQKFLLTILDDIIATCDKYNIQYQLSGGSTLGAIRHSGFIPWDDDMDINMPRKDVDKFLVEFKKEFGNKYWIHVLGETPDYDCMMIKIISKKVRARKMLDSDKKECGLYIDIFIVENTFNNLALRSFHGLGCMFFRYILSCIKFQKNANELYNLVQDDKTLHKYLQIRSLLGRFFSIVPINWWAKATNKWTSLCKNNNSKYVVITGGSKQFFQELYERTKFSENIKVKFEGRKVNITKDYDNYLTILYGNYMEIPPENKREKHVVLELDKETLNNFTS